VRGLVCNLETLDERPELREFKRNALRIAVNWLNSYARSRSMLSLSRALTRPCGVLFSATTASIIGS
jgi:hypothetical protein